jgi:hypothetical protein
MATVDSPSSTTPVQLGYPTLRKAAEILGVNASSLSRREPEAIEVGAQKRLSARTVMAEAAYFNRRDRGEVGGALLEVAEEQCPQAIEAIEEEITDYLRELEAARPSKRPDSDWLEEARGFLPAALFERVSDAYAQSDPAGHQSGPVSD